MISPMAINDLQVNAAACFVSKFNPRYSEKLLPFIKVASTPSGQNLGPSLIGSSIHIMKTHFSFQRVHHLHTVKCYEK